jgi:Flp pilus assembly protein TadB
MLGLTGESAGAWVALTGAAVAAGVYVLALSFPAFPDPEPAAAAAGLFAGGAVYAVLWTPRNRRRRAIQEQLPDGLFQLSWSLRSGLALPDALRETAHHVPAPLAGLFDRLAAALALGESTRAAARRAAADAELTEFELFAEVLLLTTAAGGTCRRCSTGRPRRSATKTSTAGTSGR